MSDETDTATEPPKRTRRPLIVGAGLAVVLAGVGFSFTYSGLLTGSGDAGEHGIHADALPPVSYVPIEPILVSLAHSDHARHLRFRAHLEVDPKEQHNVELQMPRILDVLNGYLRALDVADLERSTALIRLRAQMLRRVQLTVGEGRVRDLLVTEFVLN